MTQERIQRDCNRCLQAASRILLLAAILGTISCVHAASYTAADCSCGAIGLSSDGGWPVDAPQNNYYALTCQYGGYANIPHAGEGMGVEFEIHTEKPDAALSEFNVRAAALPPSNPGSPDVLEFDRSDPDRAVYSFRKQEGSKTSYSGTHVLVYKNANYIFVYGAGFDVGDGRFLSMMNAAESCAKAVADAGSPGTAGRVSLDYYPYNGYNKSEIQADQGTRFTATVSGLDSSSMVFVWSVDGEQQKTDLSEPNVFTWVPPVNGMLPAGRHTVTVVVTDKKGGRAESTVTVFVILPHAWLNVIIGSVTINGNECPPLQDLYIIREHDLIATSKWLNPGLAVLHYNDGTQLVIDAGTEVFIQRFNLIRIENGNGYFWAVPGHGSFIVDTPVLYGAPRGTEFEVRVDGVNASEVFVFGGSVAVSDTAGKKTVDLAAGMTTRVTNASVPADPAPFDTASHNRWWERYSQKDALAQVPSSRSVQGNSPDLIGQKGAAVKALEDAGKNPVPLLIVVIVPLLIIIIAVVVVRHYGQKP